MSLDRLLGEWDFTMQHVAVSEPVRGHQRYEPVLGGAFVLLTWTHERPEFPDALVVLGQGASHYFDVRGVVRAFELDVDDEGWSMVRRDADFWQRSTARFVGVDRMEGTGENSHDEGASWEHDYSVVWTRVG